MNDTVTISNDEYFDLLKCQIFKLQCELHSLPQHIKDELGIMFLADLPIEV